MTLPPPPAGATGWGLYVVWPAVTAEQARRTNRRAHLRALLFGGVRPDPVKARAERYELVMEVPCAG